MLNGRLVLFGSEGQPNGCNFYRIKQPLTYIAEKDIFPCATSSMLTGDDLDLWIDKADIIVSQKATSDKFLEFMFEQHGKQKFCIDLDDNIFAVSPYNPSYYYHGVKEVDFELPNGKMVQVRDGLNGFDLKANELRLKICVNSLRLADMVTTPSSVLAGKLKNLGAKNVRVIKNFINFEHWQKLSLVKDEFIRIGWQGGMAHFEDWCEISDAIRRVMERYSNVLLVIMGTHYKGTTIGFPEDRIVAVQWLPIEIYPYKFKTLGIDIGIAPITNTEFSTCKSEIKWEEYSALEIPCVASNIPPYNLNIDDGKTGFLCKDKDDWYETLCELVESKELRDKIGIQARKRIESVYDISIGVKQYESAYNSLVGKKELISV